MRARCRICGLLDPGSAYYDRMGRCYACRSAYQRFRSDKGWGMTTKGGFAKTVTGKLRYDGPRREVPFVPPGTWFRYIVRERLLRGLSRYPYTYSTYEDKHIWNPDKMPPWDDVHTAPWDIGKMTPARAITLGLVDIPHEQPDPRLSDIGPWGPPEQY